MVCRTWAPCYNIHRNMQEGLGSDAKIVADIVNLLVPPERSGKFLLVAATPANYNHREGLGVEVIIVPLDLTSATSTRDTAQKCMVNTLKMLVDSMLASFGEAVDVSYTLDVSPATDAKQHESNVSFVHAIAWSLE